MCESDPTLSTRVLEDAGGDSCQVPLRFRGVKGGGGGQVVLLPACTQPTHSARFLNAYAKKRKMVQMVLNALSPFFPLIVGKKGYINTANTCVHKSQFLRAQCVGSRYRYAHFGHKGRHRQLRPSFQVSSARFDPLTPSV